MDAVRFGRALGFGARQAAKTVVKAVDAAKAENPTRPPVTGRPGPASQAAVVQRSAAATLAASQSRVVPVSPAPSTQTPRSSAQVASHAATQARGMSAGIRNFRDATVEPVVRLSGVLWLEVVGVFFGIFALSSGIAVWRLRDQWKDTAAHPGAHGSLIGAAGICLLFGYFCVSSFIRARRRQHRRG